MNAKEKAIKLAKSLGLSPLWRLNNPQNVQSLFKEYAKYSKIKRVHLVQRLAFEVLLANLLNAYHKKKVLHLFLASAYSYELLDLNKKIPAKHFSRLVKFLKAKHYIEFYPGYRVGDKAASSKIIVLEKFINWMPDDVEEKKTKAPLVILKNKDKKIVEHRDVTPRLQWLENYNRLLEKSYISVGDKLLSPQQIYRVYNVNFTRGGRFYGGDFQTLPKKERKKIRIDGSDCVELDYHCLHVNLLYFQENSRFSGDAYLLPSYGTQYRNFVKYALMIVLNAASFQMARKAIAFRAAKNKIKVNVTHLMKELEERHAPISHNFYKAEVAGKLQNGESKIAAKIIQYFTAKKILVLPIHDGFIIQSKYNAKLRLQMQKAFQEYTHSDFKIPVLRA